MGKKQRNKDPTGKKLKNVKTDKPSVENEFKMMTTYGEHYYAWNGKLYESDLVRACIRPKVQAVGKLVAKHLRDDAEKGLQLYPVVYIRELLLRPNPYMTGQQMQEKLATQLCLTGNAFALIVRDPNGLPIQLYPITASAVTAKFDNGQLYLEFTFRNTGLRAVFDYRDIVHLRKDFYENEVFGTNPAPALAQLMDCIGTIDQGVVNAVQNSSEIRWLLQFNSAMRPEDIKANAKTFAENYLKISEDDSLGVAAVDAKATAKEIEPKDYVPNAAVTDKLTDRIYSFFNTNKNIVQSNYTEDQWISYYEAEIEPVAVQMSDVMTGKLFTRREIGVGNKIVYEASNLTYASMATKLALVSFFDRGIFCANEIRAILNLAPIDGGDRYYMRLDTAQIESSESETVVNTEDREGGETDGESGHKRRNRAKRL